MSEKTLGPALRTIGSGPIEVMMRAQDWGTKDLGERGVAFGQELVAFKALTFREVDSTDVWEFSLIEEGPDGLRRRLRVFVCGSDLLMVRRDEAPTA